MMIHVLGIIVISLYLYLVKVPKQAVERGGAFLN